MQTTTFTAICERAGRWWTIRVPQIEGLAFQVRGLDQAETIARQSISRSLGVPADGITVEVVTDVPPSVTYALQARHAARHAAEVADKATREALDALATERYPFYDAIALLGLSPAEAEHYAPARDAGPAGHAPADDDPLLMTGK